MAMGSELLKAKQTAELLGLKVNTLAHWRLKGIGPPWLRIGGHRVAYPARELSTWIQSQPRGGAPADKSTGT